MHGSDSTARVSVQVLHGLSQVVQGVVVRTGKRMTMRDKAKDKTLLAREQQTEKLKKVRTYI